MLESKMLLGHYWTFLTLVMGLYTVSLTLEPLRTEMTMDGLKVQETDQERFERQNIQLSKENMQLVSECATMKVK